MADRLQKTLEVGASIASVGSPPTSESTLARVLPAAGQVVRGLITERKKEGLEEDLRGLGEEVFAVREGKDLEDATERFKRLKKAKDQGILSDSMINIEAEKVLKQKIGINSTFAPELRREAARILGFDPTGSEIRALFGGDKKSRPLTPQEKRRQQAEGIANVLNIDADNVERSIAKAEFSQVQLDNVTTQASLGQIASRDVLNVALNGVDSFISDATADLIMQIDQGGVVNPEIAVARLTQAKEASWSNYRQTLVRGGVNLAASDLIKQRKTFDESFQADIDLFGDQGTLDVILKRQRNSMVNEAAIIGLRAFPGLSVIGASPLGQAGVEEYLKLTTRIKDPSQLEVIKRFNPGFAAIIGNQKEVSEAVRSSYNRILGIPNDINGDINIPGLDDTVTRDLIKEAKDPNVRDTVVNFLRGRGQSFKDIGDYAQKGVRAISTNEDVKHVKERWAIEFEPLIARISSTLKDSSATIVTVEREEEVRFVGAGRRKRRKVVQEAGIFLEVIAGKLTSGRSSGTTAPIPSSLEVDIKRLNGMNKLVQNGWAGDVGEVSAGFLERTVNKIETVKADVGDKNDVDQVGEAIDTFRQNPSPENFESIRKLDPDLATAVESELARRSGGSTDGE